MGMGIKHYEFEWVWSGSGLGVHGFRLGWAWGLGTHDSLCFKITLDIDVQLGASYYASI